MKFFPIIFVAFLMQSLHVMAQHKDSTSLNRRILTETIKGTVLDKSSRLPLAGVTIRLTSNPSVKVSSTDQNGVFRLIDVPLGRQVLQASITGYQQVVLAELLITSGKENVLNLEMEPQTNNLNEVVVNANSGKKPLNQMAMVSGRSFSPEETNRYAGAFFDPARMAQSFPGVVAGGDDNEIIVRGNSPKSLQWRLEGIEIVNPNHFGSEGASGGGVSMINTTVLSTSDFYTGGLAAEYGNAISGVFDLKFRKGNTDKREYAFNIGVLGAGATLEGPFKKGGSASYLVSYRYSSLSLLEKVGVEVSDSGTPKYQDLSFNFVFPTKKAGTFSLFGIGGLGKIDKVADHDYTKWEERSDGSNLSLGFNAGSAGLKHLYIANSKLYFNNIVSVSASRSSNTTDTLSKSYQPSLDYKDRYTNTAIRYAGSLNYKLNASNTIRAGVNASLLKYDLYALNHDRQLNTLKELINQQGNTSSYDGFVQHKAELNSKLTLNTGVHVNYFNLSKTWSFEPRLGLKYQLSPDQLLSFGTGLYSRLEPLSYYFAKSGVSSGTVQSVKPLTPTKSAQAVLGYEKLFGGNLKFKTEVYYQHLYDVPVSLDPTVNFSLLNVSDNSAISSSAYRQLVNKGTGKNYGIEFSLEKSLSKGYYFIATTSLFDSKFKALSGREFNTTFNTRYVGNLLAGKEWIAGKKKNNIFGLNAKLIYAGGRKYSPILVEESFRLDEEVIDQDKINTLTADPYVRVDFSASYRINSKRVSHLIIIDIQNLLNRENTVGMFYNSSKRIIEPQKWSGIIPTINYRIEF
ncbi:Outer membrane receptor proteins, mostly Fe transport [Pedobacter sp. ok626]|uniref:TonB-dependent receptor n=1 Tax=Pedobacter sp. ok626 TaxID=1761882 RepID=UPI00088A099B|nr:TonB-dependent receptor [Pedobacter sp. ok626]SDL84990.1 Outer membrane receptor proteins, mostly Fe transport [Pedobacter sp. ok626]